MQVDIVNLTPSVSRLVDPSLVPSLRVLILAGEPVSKDDAKKWSNSGVKVINAYGPAECSILSTVNTTADVTGDFCSIGTGRGLVTWITDAQNSNVLVPPGCDGELFLKVLYSVGDM
jgi:acyl-coenzyme A synthetase/AMP-(fatty) acid ligase